MTKSLITTEQTVETRLFSLDDYIGTGILSEADRGKLLEAARILKDGGLVAFPTETVYGLGGNALLPSAARRIYAAKGRPSDNPLIVHIADLADLRPLVSNVPENARRLAECYWPGPLTMVFPKAASVPEETTGGLSTVAVRYPVHPVARELIRLAGIPVAAPSANRSGRPSTTTAAHCIEDLFGRVDAIVDGGSADIGVESTILDVSTAETQLLRPGAVTREMVEETLGTGITVDVALLGPLSDDIRPKAPGMKYRHYAPKAPMQLVVARENPHLLAPAIFSLLQEQLAAGRHPALLATEECLQELRALAGFPEAGIIVLTAGSRSDPDGLAHGLFEHLRKLDETAADCIIAEGCSEEQLGYAIMNRMKKAAAWQITTV